MKSLLLFYAVLLALVLTSGASAIASAVSEELFEVVTQDIHIPNSIGDVTFIRIYDSELNTVCYATSAEETMQCIELGD